MVFETIYQWKSQKIPTEYTDAAIVFHTSCVNFPSSDLQHVNQLGLKCVLPDNVFRELSLLQESAVFGEKAKCLLRICGTSPNYVARWDLEQLYENSRKVKMPDKHSLAMVFVFGDLNKLDEFLRCIRVDAGNLYVMLCEGWSCVDGIATVYPVQSLKGYAVRRVEPLTPHLPARSIADYPSLCVKRSANACPHMVDGKSFHPTRMYGGNASIFESTDFPNHLMKGYKGFALTGSQVKKLENLQYLGQSIPGAHMALPEALLYRDDSSIVGYIMKKIDQCTAVRTIMSTGWEAYDLPLILRRLLLLILELHCMHIIVNDLSFNNVLIGKNNDVYLVDCDSFQMFHYPGGGITEIYEHPELDPDKAYNTLREPRHEYFSLAVLLFQCLFFDDPLRQVQSAEDERVLSWKNASFPLEVDGRKNGFEVNRATLRNWLAQPRKLRKAFVDEFCYKRDYSVGAWIRVLGLLD